MHTSTELKLAGISESAVQFRNRLIARLQGSFPGFTIEQLLCTPELADQFVDLIRQEVHCPSLNGAVILGTLVNIRKRKDCPTGLNNKRRRNRTKELADAGCALCLREFKELACDCLADMYTSRTIDSVLCYPDQARELSAYVRRRCDCSSLTDEMILSTIMNVRKAS